jgi:hypothetical protein
MTTPEWSSVDQGLRSRHRAGHALAAVLVALGVLGGIGLGIPIGREQQARVDAQPADPDERAGWRSANAWRDVMAPRPLPPARGYTGGANHRSGSADI